MTLAISLRPLGRPQPQQANQLEARRSERVGRKTRAFGLALLALVLTACGGGGDGAATPVVPLVKTFFIADSGNGRVVSFTGHSGENWKSLGTTGDGVKSFSSPSDVAVSPVTEKIFIADPGNDRIVQMDDMTGAGWASFGTSGFGVGEFLTPSSVAVDAAGRIYIADKGNHRIVRINDITGAGWVELGSSGNGFHQFSFPSSVNVRDNSILVADTNNHRVVQFVGMAGDKWISIGSTGSGINQFMWPTDAAYDTAGNILVADNSNGRIVRIESITGTGWTALEDDAPNDLGKPGSIAATSDGKIYMTPSNTLWRLIQMNNIAGGGYATYGTDGSGAGQFISPAGIFVTEK